MTTTPPSASTVGTSAVETSSTAIREREANLSRTRGQSADGTENITGRSRAWKALELMRVPGIFLRTSLSRRERAGPPLCRGSGTPLKRREHAILVRTSAAHCQAALITHNIGAEEGSCPSPPGIMRCTSMTSPRKRAGPTITAVSCMCSPDDKRGLPKDTTRGPQQCRDLRDVCRVAASRERRRTVPRVNPTHPLTVRSAREPSNRRVR